ncbi:hypothetical protein [Tepidimonas sp.]|uniref:hypothetical protein n=1 Tax=Tepidimonas sp. TaxID=2002775 RepID=UPI002FE081C3
MTAATADPTALRERVAASLARQGMLRHLGVRLVDAAPWGRWPTSRGATRA